jgi:HK97 family phage major capsid protein
MTTSRIAELTKVLEEKRSELKGMSGSWKDEDGKLALSTEEGEKFTKTASEVREIKALIDAERLVDEVDEYLAAPTGTPMAAFDAQARHERAYGVKSLSDAMLDSEEYKAAKERGFREPKMVIELDGVSAAALSSKNISRLTGGTVAVDTLGRPEHVGIHELRRRQWHVRDLFPKATTSAPLLYGVREVGFTNRAAQVSQRNPGNTDWVTKPESEISLEPISYPVATIAHHITAHKLILDDEPRLRQFLDTRMVDGLMLAEDEILLNGVGGSERITGITNTVGVQTYTGLSTDKKSVQIRRAATLAFLAEYEPNGIVISPVDWEDVEVEEDSQGAFRVAVSVAIGAEKRVWRLNVVETTAQTAGSFLLGAWGLGAQWYDREKVTVDVSSEHGTNFTQNLVTIRAEERGALEVMRPESFVSGSFTEFVAS